MTDFLVRFVSKMSRGSHARQHKIAKSAVYSLKDKAGDSEDWLQVGIVYTAELSRAATFIYSDMPSSIAGL